MADPVGRKGIRARLGGGLVMLAIESLVVIALVILALVVAVIALGIP